jgi:gliding motility-associated-like protein
VQTDTTRYFVINAKVTAPTIERATVIDDEYVLIEWNKPEKGILPNYHIERSTDTLWWDWISDEEYDVLSYEDFMVDVDDESYFYRINATDSCDFTGNYSNIGKTILLTVDTNEVYPTLGWSAYEEWEQGVAVYELQVKSIKEKVKSGEAFGNLAYLPPSTRLSFTDSSTSLNGEFYCYRVIAYRNGDSLESVSNVVCIPTKFRIYTPNSFTPNGDGVNDIFLPKGLFISDYSLIIFNRWGEKLFESNDINQGWDGRFKGEICPMGVYYYQILATGCNGHKEKLFGTISIVR